MTFEENCNVHYNDVVHMLPASSHPQTRGYINYLPAWPLAAYCETVYPPSSALSSLGNKICLLQWKQGGAYELSEFQTLLSLCHALQSESGASVETNPRKVKMQRSPGTLATVKSDVPYLALRCQKTWSSGSLQTA